MTYKLYIMKIKPGEQISQESEAEFNKFYKEHGVEIVGEWISEEDPNELYFMTKYRDKEHYQTFVNAMKENQRYQELTRELGPTRESVRMISLRGNPNSGF